MNQFEVCLQSRGGSPVTITVTANSSSQAKQIALAQYPGWIIASTRDLGRR